jgi:hypothetical protein
MILKTEFDDFDKRIRPDDDDLVTCREGHAELRERLKADGFIKKIHVADFLQGSYARNTINEPEVNAKMDVDIILVTKLSEEQFTPEAALHAFIPFLEENYKGKYEFQGRSIGIHLDDIDLDLVPTSAPSEAEQIKLTMLQAALEDRLLMKAMSSDELLDPEEIIGSSGAAIALGEWAREPLRIPDRHAECWQNTHPLETLRWTRKKNASCNKLFLRVIRAIKWWRKHVSQGPKHPKSYPIEHMVGDFCPQDISSVAEGVVQTLERMFATYQPYLAKNEVPWLNPRGLTNGDANVLSLVTPEDFRQFVNTLSLAAKDARIAFDYQGTPHDGALLWQKVLGKERFPVPPRPRNGNPGGFTPRQESDPQPVGGRFG